MYFSVGASTTRPQDIQFLYENHENFMPLPTFFILPSLQSVFSANMDNIIPGVEITLDKILHGEQYLEIIGELPTDGKLISKCKLVEVLDKQSGAVMVYDGNLLII